MLKLKNQLFRTSSVSIYLNTIKAAQSSTFAVGSENTNQSNEKTENQETTPPDSYTTAHLKNRIILTGLQKALLSFGSSITALLDPTRHDMIACLGETTGEHALQNILETMQSDEEGRQILVEKPRINTKTVELDRLRQLPTNTLGYAYAKFLDDNQVTPDSRMDVRFIESPELAYVMTRYRECHDLIHAVLGMPTNMLGEVAVKWVEALNTGLPMCYGGAVFGAARLRTKQRQHYLNKYLPWAIANGQNAKFIMSVYWEKRWEQDLKELQKELCIVPFSK